MVWEINAGSPATENWCAQTTGAMEEEFAGLQHLPIGSCDDYHFMDLCSCDSSAAHRNDAEMLGMMVNAFYGGCGVGILNYFIYVIVAVFYLGINGRTYA